MKYHFWVWKLRKESDDTLTPVEKIAFIKGKRKAWLYVEELYMKSEENIYLGLELLSEPENQFFYCFPFPFRRGNVPKIAFQLLDDRNRKYEPPTDEEIFIYY